MNSSKNTDLSGFPCPAGRQARAVCVGGGETVNGIVRPKRYEVAFEVKPEQKPKPQSFWPAESNGRRAARTT